MDPLGTVGCVAIAIGVAVGLSFLELICGEPVSVGLLDIDRGGRWAVPKWVSQDCNGVS
jgi:hypothetical protein